MQQVLTSYLIRRDVRMSAPVPQFFLFVTGWTQGCPSTVSTKRQTRMQLLRAPAPWRWASPAGHPVNQHRDGWGPTRSGGKTASEDSYSGEKKGRWGPRHPLPAVSFGSLNQSREMNSKDFHSRPRYSTLRDESHPSFTCVCVKVAQSCSTPGDPIQSMGFSRPEHWSGEPVPSPGDLPNLGIDPGLLHCRQILYQLGHQGSHSLTYRCSIILSFFLSAFGCHAVSRCGLVFIHPATISVQSFSLKPHIFLTFCKILAYFSCILPVYHAVPLELIWDVLNLLPSLCPPCLLTSHWYFLNFLS